MKTNYHTHSTFCDGKNTLEEMILTAIEKDFQILGFSSHSMYPFATDWHLPVEKHEEYVKSLRELKDKYKDQIDVQIGFEADFIQGLCFPDFESYKNFNPDFLIGSVHFVPGKNGFFEADGNIETVKKEIKNSFNGNIKKAVQEYFYLEREMLKKANFSIMGHPDLIKMQNHKEKLFDENEFWYKKEIKILAKEISRSGVCVEVNTGGLARKKTNSPYPSYYFLEELKKYNVPLCLNSDCHNKEFLDYGFDETIQELKKIGYKELSFFIAGKINHYKI